jgi:hypothetical protein
MPHIGVPPVSVLLYGMSPADHPEIFREIQDSTAQFNKSLSRN